MLPCLLIAALALIGLIGGVLLHRDRIRAATREAALARADLGRSKLAAVELDDELRQKTGELERHIEELQRATRLKNELLASMSHELRTPLNAVIGFSSVLLEETYGPLNHKQRECSEDVIEAGRQLLALTNDMLDLSKMSATRKLKADASTRAIPVIAVTAQAMVGDAERARRRMLGLHLQADRSPAPPASDRACGVYERRAVATPSTGTSAPRGLLRKRVHRT